MKYSKILAIRQEKVIEGVALYCNYTSSLTNDIIN